MSETEHTVDKAITKDLGERAVLDDAFKKGFQAMKNADYDRTVKVFGLFEVDSGIAGLISGFYNTAAKWLSNRMGQDVYDLTTKYGAKAGLKDGMLKRTAAVVTIGMDFGLKSGKYLISVWDSFAAHHKADAKLARTLAPVLDELKGRHSYSALKSVGIHDNEVIYAHRQRIAKEAKVKKVNSFIDLVVNVLPNMAFDVSRSKSLWKGRSPDRFETLLEIQQRRFEKKKHKKRGFFDDISNLLNVGTGEIAERFQKSNEYKLMKNRRPYSAFQMIEELNRQMEGAPNATSFSPARGEKSYSLESYIAKVMVQHQLDMADLSPEHAELRPALQEDVMEAAKLIAKAIRAGELSPLSLVRLVGEGKIIKNQGRAIASVDEVKEQIAHEAPQQTILAHADPEKYFKQSPLTKTDMKTVLGSLEGEEKRLFASMVPISVLIAAGMSEKEAKAHHAVPLEQHERETAELLVGRLQQSEDVKKGTLTQHEAEHLDKKAELVEKQGVAAVQKLKCSATKEDGVETDIVNWVGPQLLVQGSKLHLGKVQEVGREELEALEHKKANDNKHPHAKNHHPARDHRAHAEHGNLAHDLG